MKNYVIPPLKHLEYSELGEAGFYILAHLYLQHPHYREYVREQKAKGRYLLLDNSAAENALVTEDQLIGICKDVLPDLVVAPDVLFDRDQTEQNLTNFALRLVDEGLSDKIGLFYCPQGTTRLEWLSSYVYGLSHPQVKVIGLSKIAVPKCFLDLTGDKGIAEARNECVKTLFDKKLIIKQIHLLGNGSFGEFEYYKSLPEEVRQYLKTTDSCYVMLSAANAIDFTKGDQTRIPTPHDYFDYSFNEDQLMLAHSNGMFFRDLISGI